MFDLVGPLAEHMAVHIVAMNVVAPVAVLALGSVWPANHGTAIGRRVGAATVVQILALWCWHLPPVFQAAAGSTAGLLAMQLSLLLAALWFWYCIIFAGERARWRSLLALLSTGKLFCLLGVLLTFAPRPLYPRLADIHLHAGLPSEATLPDQQLAGLLMLVACPLTYVLAGVVLAARWLLDWSHERALPGEHKGSLE